MKCLFLSTAPRFCRPTVALFDCSQRPESYKKKLKNIRNYSSLVTFTKNRPFSVAKLLQSAHVLSSNGNNPTVPPLESLTHTNDVGNSLEGGQTKHESRYGAHLLSIILVV